jgi:hypothetical protein
MKTPLLFSSILWISASINAQVIPSLANGYPTGEYKREQRIITKFTSPTATPKSLQYNMRSVGKSYAFNDPKTKHTRVEYTYTEISGIKRTDGVVTDLGNPIEDKTEYAYRIIYDENGQAESVQGRDVYVDAVINGNVHDITQGSYYMYFLHTMKPRKLGDTWTDSIFSYPLLEHIPMTFTFEKMETTDEGKTVPAEGKTAARINISGNLNYPEHYGMMGDTPREMNLTGTVNGYMHVDVKTNRIYRIKATVNLKGTINIDGKNEPYEVELKIHEWEMNVKHL